jgi:hypothetical protein
LFELLVPSLADSVTVTDLEKIRIQIHGFSFPVFLPFIRLHLLAIHQVTRPLVHPFFYSFLIYPSIFSFIHSSQHSFIYQFIHSSSDSHIHPSIFHADINYSFIHPFIHSFNDPLINQLINSFIVSDWEPEREPVLAGGVPCSPAAQSGGRQRCHPEPSGWTYPLN